MEGRRAACRVPLGVSLALFVFLGNFFSSARAQYRPERSDPQKLTVWRDATFATITNGELLEMLVLVKWACPKSVEDQRSLPELVRGCECELAAETRACREKHAAQACPPEIMFPFHDERCPAPQGSETNLRRAAASALAGWYLMAPPLNSDLKVDYHASLSKWALVASYDSAAECEKKRHHDLMQAAAASGDSESAELSRGVSREIYRQTMQNLVGEASGSVCIASNDPRLKEK